jgi:hypothetical protein
MSKGVQNTCSICITLSNGVYRGICCQKMIGLKGQCQCRVLMSKIQVSSGGKLDLPQCWWLVLKGGNYWETESSSFIFLSFYSLFLYFVFPTCFPFFFLSFHSFPPLFLSLSFFSLLPSLPSFLLFIHSAKIYWMCCIRHWKNWDEWHLVPAIKNHTLSEKGRLINDLKTV